MTQVNIQVLSEREEYKYALKIGEGKGRNK
jgi:hypothetical protein